MFAPSTTQLSAHIPSSIMSSTITTQLKKHLTLALSTLSKTGLAPPQSNYPSFYTKLNKYFPECEMKRCSHFLALLNEKPGIYKKDESDDHVLMFSDHVDFLVIDYIWVSSEMRGRGVGKQLIAQMKESNLPIYLEVEQPSKDDPDSLKRLRFYAREGFRHANDISYVRKAALTGERIEMEVLYWAPLEVPTPLIMQQMRTFYTEIHAWNCEKFYGRQLLPPSEVLQRLDAEKDDMLRNL